MILESLTLAGIAAVCAQISPIVTVGKGALDVAKYSNQWRHVESASLYVRSLSEAFIQAYLEAAAQ